MALFRSITPSTDTITETTKVTKGFFQGDVGQIGKFDGTESSGLTTSSLSSTQKNYYYTLQYNSVDHFGCTYGHIGGSGSDLSANNLKGETEAVYRQFANYLLGTDAHGGFKFPSGSTGNLEYVNSLQPEQAMYFIVAERDRMKDRINRKNWTIMLSGSKWEGSGSNMLKLTDDSEDIAAVQTVVGPRYNIVSGALGSVNTAASSQLFGWFYPNVGIFALRQSELSASIPGYSGSTAFTDTYNDEIGGAGASWGAPLGLAKNDNNVSTVDNALKLAMTMVCGSVSMRNEEDQTTVSHFCRANAGDFNFSTNPTFTSGSNRAFRVAAMESDPQTFITSIGLYNSKNELVAVGRLSSPVQKNYQTETTIKVNLTY